MKCPECGAAELKPMRRDLPHTYKDHITIIPNVSGHECPVCDEILVSMEDGKRVSDAMLAFNREVNAMLGDPDFIAGVRKKLNLNQGEAGEIFGGGVAPVIAGNIAQTYGIQYTLFFAMGGQLLGIVLSLFFKETAPRLAKSAKTGEVSELDQFEETHPEGVTRAD